MNYFKLMVIGIVLLITNTTSAQVEVNINIGSPPLWGPVGYSDVRYYYLPDVEAYYDIQTAMFIYYGEGVWIRRTYLPTRYRYYDLYSGYKVVMTDYRGDRPYVYFKKHKVQYAKGYHGNPQKTIGMKPSKGNTASKASHEDHSNNTPNQKSGKNSGAGNSGSKENHSTNTPTQKSAKNSGSEKHSGESHGQNKGGNSGHGGGKGGKK